jgi:flagellar biosynthesis/type III secretory pathway M-ring protein FliF/YscJ
MAVQAVVRPGQEQQTMAEQEQLEKVTTADKMVQMAAVVVVVLALLVAMVLQKEVEMVALELLLQ